ncbi:MAG: hypothetical protein AAGC65_04405 [Mucilaginibacter sp.]|uniref:hypothetical protein n=1 Tax=Mucilaginibacter sp. TaxID=1882438 RepID=UPI0031A2D5A2
MKRTTTKISAIQTKNILKAIDRELKSILAKDIRKMQKPEIRQAAFLQMISA